MIYNDSAIGKYLEQLDNRYLHYEGRLPSDAERAEEVYEAFHTMPSLDDALSEVIAAKSKGCLA